MKQLKLPITIIIVLILTSCVSTKHFNELSGKLTNCEEENGRLNKQNMELSTKVTELEGKVSKLKSEKDKLLKEIDDLSYSIESSSRKLKNIEDEKEGLLWQLDRIKSGSSEEIKKLLEELEAARGDLNTREDKLREAEKELQARNTRLIEMEKALARKNQAVKELKAKVADALVGFNNNGLSVYEKDGKVYVSLEERLLFKTGKWHVDPNGQKALKKLSAVLAQNPDINVMVEGHTDNIPMQGSGEVKDNWDLSVMRATAVTKILTQNKQLAPKRIIAAGRSKYIPVDSNETAEGRQKNRRTEIILTPKLDELMKLIESD